MALQSGQHSRSLQIRNDTDRSTPAEFAAALTPCLALVGGIGMDGQARREWLNAAFVAMGDVPADLLKQGARAAMLKADHPSKILPTIMEEIRPSLDRRRTSIARASEYAELIARQQSELVDTRSEPEKAEIGALMANLVKRLEASS
jgi:hypothetical protein